MRAQCVFDLNGTEPVSSDFENFEFNTIVSGLMELLNDMYKARESGAVGTPEWDEANETYLKMLAPVAPHIAEELWTNQLGKPYSIHQQPFPRASDAVLDVKQVPVAVQLNGRTRGLVQLAPDATEAEAVAAARSVSLSREPLDATAPLRIVYVPGRIVNFVL